VSKTPTSVSPDGRLLLYHEQFAETGFDILAVPLQGERTPRVLVRSGAADLQAVFSPDGRFFAYVSNESGRWEVYVRPYPDALAWRRLVSTQGGRAPVWGPDGRELFYFEDLGGVVRDETSPGVRLMVVSVDTEPEFSPRVPRELLAGEFMSMSGNFRAAYDISPDGQRFALLRPSRQAPSLLYFFINWFEELKRLVPPAR
jgi:hypothetical protein